jgi:CPA1 family monovalent cation:H+ antiporter
LREYSISQLIGYGALVSSVVILIRPVWVFPGTWLPRLLSKRLRERDPIPPWRYILIVSWSGMRGVVSLAAALALPTALGGRPFPERNLLIFLTFCVILATLVIQGLSLPFIIRWLGIRERYDGKDERDARLKLAQAALAHLEELAGQNPRNETTIQQLRAIYQERIRNLHDDLADVLGWSDQREHWIFTRRLKLESLAAERRELIKLRREDQLDEELMHKIERELDLEETRLQA